MSEMLFNQISNIDKTNQLIDLNIVKKMIGSGKEHKEARQSQTKLGVLFESLGVGCSLLPEYLENTKNHSVFTGVQFEKSNISYIGLKQTNIGDTQFFDPIKIIGGTCIGGSETFVGFDANSTPYSLLESDQPDKLVQPINNVKYNPKPTIYEIDTISKISEFINNMLKNGLNSKKVTMFWHIPLPEYFLYLKQYQDSGVLNIDQSTNIALLLKKRANILKNWLSNKVNLDKIQTGSPLEGVVNIDFLINNQINLEILLSQLYQNHQWKAVIDYSPITTWTQLADASYTIMYLLSSKEQVNLIGIENPEEAKIFSEAKKIAQAKNLSFKTNCLYPYSKNIEMKASPPRLYRHANTNSVEALTVYRSYHI